MFLALMVAIHVNEGILPDMNRVGGDSDSDMNRVGGYCVTILCQKSLVWMLAPAPPPSPQVSHK